MKTRLAYSHKLGEGAARCPSRVLICCLFTGLTLSLITWMPPFSTAQKRGRTAASKPTASSKGRGRTVTKGPEADTLLRPGSTPQATALNGEFFATITGPSPQPTGEIFSSGQFFLPILHSIAAADTGLQFYPLAHPVRLLDTRAGEPACYTPGAPLATGGTRTQPARVTCDGLTIPATAQAVVGNATVVNFISGAGFITLWPSGAARPTVSNLNYTANQVVPNFFIVGLGSSDGAFNIFASSSTHFIVDITGYFAP